MASPRVQRKGFFMTIDVVLSLLVLFLAIALAFYYFSLPSKNTLSSLTVRSSLQDAASVMVQKGVLGASLQPGAKPDLRGAREVLRNTPDSVCMQVSVYGQPAQDPSMVGWWKFDDSSGTVFDSSGGGNPGTVTNAAWTPNGKIDGAFLFNGADTYISIPTSANQFYSEQGTFAAWVYYLQPSLNHAQGIINKVWGGVKNNRFYSRRDNGRLEFQPTAWDVKTYTCENATLSQNTWQHVALVSYESGGMLNTAFYLNGEKKCSWSDTVDATLYFDNGTRTREIGQVQNDSTYKAFFNGTIDDVRIYSRALSDSEINRIYSSELPLRYTVAKDRCPYNGGEVQSLTFPFAYNIDQDNAGYYAAVMKAWPKGVS